MDLKLLQMSSETQLAMCSCNGRGYNLSKQNYVKDLLSRCTILFLQEHWLSEDQCMLLDDLRQDVSHFAVCGFSNIEVLSGRPFGGCAIIWRHDLLHNMRRIHVNSRRVIAATCEIASRRLLFINMYLPCDDNTSINTDSFLNEILSCESLLDEFLDYEIIIGGDLNVDFCRNSINNGCLIDFCKRCNLICADFHSM
jgi:exonuclease III